MDNVINLAEYKRNRQIKHAIVSNKASSSKESTINNKKLIEKDRKRKNDSIINSLKKK